MRPEALLPGALLQVWDYFFLRRIFTDLHAAESALSDA